MFAGVYKAQIDTYQPKVTVIGNVDAQTLIKKLAKAGKTAEVWPSESQKPSKEENKVDSGKKAVDISTTNVKDKTKNMDTEKKSDNKECKCSISCASAESNGIDSCKVGGYNKEERTNAHGFENGTTCSGSTLETAKNVFPVPQPGIVHEAGSVGSYMPYCYPIEPPMVHPMYYTVGAYLAPPPYYAPDRCYYELPAIQPPVQSTAPRFTDYFNDDNTVGCSIM